MKKQSITKTPSKKPSHPITAPETNDVKAVPYADVQQPSDTTPVPISTIQRVVSPIAENGISTAAKFKKVLIDLIRSFWDFFEAIFGGMLIFIDKYNVVRKLSLAFTFWLTYDSYAAAKTFVFSSHLGGAEITLMVAAITVPVSALQGFVFKWYLDSSGRDRDRITDYIADDRHQNRPSDDDDERGDK